MATSFGALLALDPLATVFAACGARDLPRCSAGLVSLASLGGGLFFVLTHFARTPDPFGRDERTL